MNYEQNLPPRLVTLATYTSPKGGSHGPRLPQANHLLFEIIQEGAVYGFEDPPVLHGEGTVFCHYAQQTTVSKSPSDGYYSCLVASFECHTHDDAAHWLRCFQWTDWQAMNRFIDEMLYAFHQTSLNHITIGNLIWSRLQFELEQFQLQQRQQSVHPQLRIATDFMNANYQDALNLDDIAHTAGISVSHLHMLFREHLNESPHQYLIQKRMRAAGHALATSDLPIKAIAANVGYPNTENFCRAFRKFFGRSASEYRQAYSHASHG